MKRKAFVIYAHGRQCHAQLKQLATEPARHEMVCSQCGELSGMTLIATAKQYGFHDDKIWDVYNCSLCQHNTAFEYEKKLTFEQTVSRLK